MTSPDLERALRATLSVPITTVQSRGVEARLRARLDCLERSPTRLRPRTVGLLLASLLLVAPTVFVVSAVLRTTEAPNGLVSASHFQAEVDAAMKVVPLPAGASWPPTIGATDPNGTYSAGGGRASVEFPAFCAWSVAWLEASDAGARADADAAERVIVAAPGWEFYSGDFGSDSLRAAIDAVVAGVAIGDAEPVRSFVAANCSG